MSTTSAAEVIVAVKAALVERIGELDGFATEVPVDWSHPLKTMEKRHAWVGDYRNEQKWASMGERQREISGGGFEFYIYTEHEGGTAEEAERDALDLLRVVERWLRTNETAGIDLADLPGCKHLRLDMASFDFKAGVADNARAALLEGSIGLYARI